MGEDQEARIKELEQELRIKELEEKLRKPAPTFRPRQKPTNQNVSTIEESGGFSEQSAAGQGIILIVFGFFLMILNTFTGVANSEDPGIITGIGLFCCGPIGLILIIIGLYQLVMTGLDKSGLKL